MSNGERIIVKLDPNYNPTGKPMPDEMLEQMKVDPDFAKLSQAEQEIVANKIKNLIQEPKDLVKYGTLKQKVEKCISMKGFYLNQSGVPFISLPLVAAKNYNEIKHIVEGCTVSADANVLLLVAANYDNVRIGGLLGFGIGVNDTLSRINSIEKYFVADIKAPISGKLFSLCEMKNSYIKVNWNDDLFIVSSIPDDTRSAAIKWYKETTGKEPLYKTSEDIQEEEAAQKANVDSFLSKWDL